VNNSLLSGVAMAKLVCCVALVLATVVSTGAACTFTHAGFCVAVKKDTVAGKDGIAMPDGTAVAVNKGVKTPTNGYWMPGCTVAKKDETATSDGKLWATVSSTAVTVKKGAKAANAGVFCPTAKVNTCKGVAKGTAAGESGVFVPDVTTVAVKKGAKAPLDGFWCEGCQLLTAETTVTGAGKHWTRPSATPTSVAKGAKAGVGVFCLDTLKKSTSSGGSGSTGGNGTAKVSGASTMTLLSAAAISSMVGIFGQLS
jgi:hypothetical protein